MKQRDLRLYMMYTCDDCCISLRWRLTRTIQRSNRDDCLSCVPQVLWVYPGWASEASSRSWPSGLAIESSMCSKAPILPYLSQVRKIFLALRKRRSSFSFLSSVSTVVVSVLATKLWLLKDKQQKNVSVNFRSVISNRDCDQAKNRKLNRGNIQRTIWENEDVWGSLIITDWLNNGYWLLTMLRLINSGFANIILPLL